MSKFGKLFNKSITTNNSACYINILCAQLYEDIINKHITPNKTKTLSEQVFDKIPQQFWHSFILGYFDGDGYLGTKTGVHFVIVSASKPFIERLNYILSTEVGIIHKQITTNGSISGSNTIQSIM